nr:leucine zipper domain-containing protein [Methylobacterium sp. J-030]
MPAPRVAGTTGVCVKTVGGWIARFAAGGLAGLQDRSSRPHTARALCAGLGTGSAHDSASRHRLRAARDGNAIGPRHGTGMPRSGLSNPRPHPETPARSAGLEGALQRPRDPRSPPSRLAAIAPQDGGVEGSTGSHRPGERSRPAHLTTCS